MSALENLLVKPVFSLNQREKNELYGKEMARLTAHHFKSCPPYQAILNSLGWTDTDSTQPEEQPFIPVRMFKEYALKSICDEQVQKTMTSSGTTGQQVSQIFLDRETATNQTKVLAKIVADLIGPARLPMLVIDAKETVKSRSSFSARGAGILGFSMFGRGVTYALNADMSLNKEAVDSFCEKYGDGPVFIFGFTSIIYQHFILPLQRSEQKLRLDQAVLLHGGGWKKLQDIAVSNEDYKEQLNQVAGIQQVHNYYGMVEQTGSIFTECSAGHLHASVFSDVLIRDKNLNIAPMGEKGLIQLMSLLPSSYPGHNILTEDEGAILGIDDCSCGRLGKYFKVYGRAKKAEIRGCSDTYAAA